MVRYATTRLHAPGAQIAMTCHRCGKVTLTFNERTRRWHCKPCKRTLTIEEAVEEVAESIVSPEHGLQSNFVALMSGVFAAESLG